MRTQQRGVVMLILPHAGLVSIISVFVFISAAVGASLELKRQFVLLKRERFCNSPAVIHCSVCVKVILCVCHLDVEAARACVCVCVE